MHDASVPTAPTGPYSPDPALKQRAEDACLLMFSGGRDSTLAAMRIGRSSSKLVLVTVSSGHLVGIERVRRRLAELAGLLPAETRWLLVRQPEALRTDTSFYKQTCLPCHHAYVVVSGAISRSVGASRLAFGYAGYQADWPEQTPMALQSLSSVLARHGITLELPVHDIASREEAIRELKAMGLTSDSLEQKCLQQVTNLRLDDNLLTQQVRLWERAIDESMSQLAGINIEVLEETLLGSLI